MRIGFVFQTLPYLPARDGFRVYGANLIRVLSKTHEIELVSLMHPSEKSELAWANRYCKSVRPLEVGHRSLWAKLKNFTSSYSLGKPLVCRGELNTILNARAGQSGWDVMHVEGGFTGGLVEGIPPMPAVLSIHDAEALRAREMLNCKLHLKDRMHYTFRKYAQPPYDRRVYPRFERTIVVAQRDCDFLERLVPSARFAVVPHGIDTEYFRPIASAKKSYEMVFHGHFGYPPNVQAAVDFAKGIFPLVQAQFPQATFHLVGADPRPEVRELASRPGIRLSANLPDLREAVSSAQVYVCPIRFGTGLKNKLLEAMAMEMSIVAYHPESTTGIDCVPGKHLLGASTPQEFAASVTELFRQPAKAEQIATAARLLILERYSWESRARTYEELYQAVIAEREVARENGARP